MQDQKNFILALVLSGLVMMGYWFFFAKPMAEEARLQIQLEQSKIAAQTQVEAPAPVKPRAEVLNAGQRIKIDTPSMYGSFLVEGSRFDDIHFKNYKQTIDPDSDNMVLLSPEGSEKAAYIFDNWTRIDGGSGANTPWTVVSGSTLTQETPVVLQHEGNGFRVERTVSVDDRYLITLDDKVTNTSGSEVSLTRKGVSRQHGLPDDLTNFFILQEGPIAIVDGKLWDMKYKKLTKKKSENMVGQSGWVGLTDKFWLSAAIAPQGKPMTANFNFKVINDVDVYEADYRLDPTILTPGNTIESKGYIFAGAKDREVLLKYQNDESIGIAEMERAIDWGFLRILTRPMTAILSWLGHNLGNFGLGIMALTFLIKLVMFPLFNKQYEGQAKMKKVQPKVKKLQKLYEGDRVKTQQEMMALYKKEGVNPAAGCLPIIPTIFIFFALYKTVLINVELRHAPFFGWINDLSAREPISILNGFGIFPWDPIPVEFLSFFAIGPLALLYGVTMAAMYTLTPPAGTDPMQQKIFKFMPWIFMFILAPFAMGLLVYWVWNNILSFLQQYYITRKFKVDTPVDAFFRKITGRNNEPDTTE